MPEEDALEAFHRDGLRCAFATRMAPCSELTMKPASSCTSVLGASSPRRSLLPGSRPPTPWFSVNTEATRVRIGLAFLAGLGAEVSI